MVRKDQHEPAASKNPSLDQLANIPYEVVVDWAHRKIIRHALVKNPQGLGYVRMGIPGQLSRRRHKGWASKKPGRKNLMEKPRNDNA